MNTQLPIARVRRAIYFQREISMKTANESIWSEPFPIELVEQMSAGCMLGHLGIEITEAGNDYLKGRMPG